MIANAPPAPFAFSPSTDATPSGSDPWGVRRYLSYDPVAFITLVRNHHRAVFHLTHALLRDEIAAEKITRQVFARARRRLEAGMATDSLIEWVYYAGLRFARCYYCRSMSPLARRRHSALPAGQLGLDLRTLVKVMVRHASKIDPHDSELLALRHVLGMSLANIAQLLRMHPYEVSNRLAWARERICKLSDVPGSRSPFAETARADAGHEELSA